MAYTTRVVEMTHINLTNHKDPARALRSAVLGIDGIQQNPRGTVITYHEGDYTDQVHNTKAGRAAWELHEQKRVILCQKKIQDEPVRYSYYAVIA